MASLSLSCAPSGSLAAPVQIVSAEASLHDLATAAPMHVPATLAGRPSVRVPEQVRDELDHRADPIHHDVVGEVAEDDPRVNPAGGAIAVGHPLASSGIRLMLNLARTFEENPSIKYGITTMCIGLGMGGTVIWENPHFKGGK